MQTSELLFILLILPLVAATLIACFGRLRGNFSGVVSIAAAGGIMAIALYLLYGGGWNGEPVKVSMEWMTLGPLTLSLGFFLNDVSALMLFVVGFVGFWIHLFSWGYMHDDAAKGRFFGGLSIFMFSMLGIVLADNLFMVFIFWELVGFSSYMLIGHYLKRDSAAAAAKKAFIVNRVGDFGFLIGIVLTYWTFGTTDLLALESAAGLQEGGISTLLGLLLFCGVLGKSAQMPLHVWLPDAMEGPTPISALIHAATMVAAGVFLLARVYFLFSVEALLVITWVGTITAVSAAIWAFAQNDIKKVLAYSTLSQLGYMVAAFGLGTAYGIAVGGEEAALYGVAAALFHLTTHAFFKALMFLGSGSIIHSLHHEQDIYKMGGLLKKMPITGFTFLLGVIAIAGIPFISAGFFSKDAILFIAKLQNPIVFGLLTFTALLTALYMGRLFVVVFLGSGRSEAASHAHESPLVMWLPLVVLAVFAVGGGYMVLYPELLHGILYDSVLHPKGSDFGLMIAISLIAGLGGLLLAFLIYRSAAIVDPLQQRVPPLWAFCRSLFFFDAIYGFYVRQIQQRVADLIDLLDTVVIGGLFVRGSAGVAGLLGISARALHTGNIGAYIWWFFAGVLLFCAYATNLISFF